MTVKINEKEFIRTIKKGTERTREFISKLTNYQGGPVCTEYLITGDIAREFVQDNFEVRVECSYRKLVNSLTKKKGVKPKEVFNANRVDIAILNMLYPIALIEVKIRANKFSTLKPDINRIIKALINMNDACARNVVGSVVFQIHVPHKINRFYLMDFLKPAWVIERKIMRELKSFARSCPDFQMKMHPLQHKKSGAIGRELEEIGGEVSWGIGGHATRYHAILIRKIR